MVRKFLSIFCFRIFLQNLFHLLFLISSNRKVAAKKFQLDQKKKKKKELWIPYSAKYLGNTSRNINIHSDGTWKIITIQETNNTSGKQWHKSHGAFTNNVLLLLYFLSMNGAYFCGSVRDYYSIYNEKLSGLPLPMSHSLWVAINSLISLANQPATSLGKCWQYTSFTPTPTVFADTWRIHSFKRLFAS